MNGRAQRFAALVGGLLLAGGGAASWVTGEHVREVGGALIAETWSVPGTDYAPAALPLGIAVLAISGLGVLARGRLRRLFGLLEVGLGVAGMTVVALGLVEAVRADGTVRATPWLALAGAVMVVGAGWSDLRGASATPLLDERYTVEGAGGEDDEWALAADEEPGDGG